MKKSVKVLIAAGILSLVCAVPAFAGGWQQTNGRYWYQYDDGSYASNGVKNIDGVNYGFLPDGYMATGWNYLGFKWFYFDTGSGAQLTGWQNLGGKWYYLDPSNDGAMATYWLDLGNKRYYLDENGAMKTGLFQLSDGTDGSDYMYQTNEDGSLKRNMYEQNGNKVLSYDANGVIKYRNNTTVSVAKVTGDSTWQYLLNESELEDQKTEDANILSDYAKDTMDHYYEIYKKKVYPKKWKSSYAYNLAQWEKHVRYKLNEETNALSTADTNLYIRNVENGNYTPYSERDDEDIEEDTDDSYNLDSDYDE